MGEQVEAEGDARMIAAHSRHATAALLEAIDAGQVPGLVLDRRGDGGR